MSSPAKSLQEKSSRRPSNRCANQEMRRRTADREFFVSSSLIYDEDLDACRGFLKLTEMISDSSTGAAVGVATNVKIA